MAKTPNNLPISSIDFLELRENFIEFLKDQEFYNDYNFRGSGISTLVDILSYNAHFIGYYVKMMMNESFIDSAVLRETLLSKAKLNGYIPKGYRSSRSVVKIRATIPQHQDNPSRSFMIRKGSHGLGANSDSDNRKYYIIDDVICYDRYLNESDETVMYISPEIIVYEGKYDTWAFRRDKGFTNQRFIIQDKNVDIETLRVYVYPDPEVEYFEEYKLASSVFSVDPSSRVFYLSTNELGQYEIFFGNDKFGRDVPHNSKIELTYVSTEGPVGDGCLRMSFIPEGEDASGRSYLVELFDATTGGTEPESIADLRFNIPNHYKRQNRLVTEDDYRGLLLSEFRNIDSVNVWGGEKNYQKNYNSVYISVKPKNGLALSRSAKAEMLRLLEKYQILGKRINIVDPYYINMNLDLFATIDTSKTSSSVASIETKINDRVKQYSGEVLNRFGNDFSNVDFLDFIRDEIPGIKSIYSEKQVWKDYPFDPLITSEHIILFGNKARHGTIRSEDFFIGSVKCHMIDDQGGNIFVVNESGGLVIPDPIGKIDYQTGNFSIFLDIGITTERKRSQQSLIRLFFTPAVPDIYTYLNNILRIESTRVHISETVR